MDLETRSRDFLHALGGLDTETVLGFFVAQPSYDFPGVMELGDRAALRGFLEAVQHNMAAIGVQGIAFHVVQVAASGSRTFAQWECVSRRANGPVLFRGIHILDWDAHGKIERACVYTDPEAVRRVSVGMKAHAARAAGTTETAETVVPP